MCSIQFGPRALTRSSATARCLLIFSLATAPCASPAYAQPQPANLGQMSIEELMNIEVTTVARKEQRARDAAAAIYVITQEEIQRSGLTDVAELLRLAPGVNVARINANKWAVSIRGFNGLDANKLLVLVDGRSVYNRLFAGVFWDAEDLMVDDIDRIEVIRGPGAALWGANGVNGVVNIVTKRASDTRGTRGRFDLGTLGSQGAIRHGVRQGATDHRFYAQWTRRGELTTAAGTGAGDASQNVRTGFRSDRTTGAHALTLQSDLAVAEAHDRWMNVDPVAAAREPFTTEATDRLTLSALGRWKYTRATGASLEMQSFVDVGSLTAPIVEYDQKIADATLQYHTPIGSRHDLVVGGTYRFSSDRMLGVPGFTLSDESDNHSHLVAAFVNDEISLINRRLALTLGTQIQYDSDAGTGVQPTARVLWRLTPRQNLWASVSRALRTPSPMDRALRIDAPPVPTPAGLPLFVTVQGSPDARTERFTDTEVGYRLDIGSSALFDVTGFVGRYDRLRNFDRPAPELTLTPSPRLTLLQVLSSRNEATTAGIEASIRWSPTTLWQLQGSYSGFRARVRATDGTPTTQDDNAPRHQWQVHASFAPAPRVKVNTAVFGVGALDALAVDGYTRTDVTAELRLSAHLSAMVGGYNVFDPSHVEFGGNLLLVENAHVPRSGSVRLRWTF